MTRRKTAVNAESAQDPENPVQPQEQQADVPASGDPASTAAPEAGKTKWNSRIGGGWGDFEAGVRLNEDHRNRRMTIKFDEKPSEEVRKLMKDEYGYRFDGENQLWYKRINPATARQAREEAEELAFQVANLIRHEKGLEQKESFSIGM